MSVLERVRKQTQQRKEEVTEVTSQQFSQLKLPAVPSDELFSISVPSDDHLIYLHGDHLKFPDVPSSEPPDEEAESSSSSGRASPQGPDPDTLKDLVPQPYLTLTGKDVDDVYQQIGAVDLSDFTPPPTTENGAASSGASSSSNSRLLVQSKAGAPEPQPAEVSRPAAPVPTPRTRKFKVGETHSPFSATASTADASPDLISFTQPAAERSSTPSPQQQSPVRAPPPGAVATLLAGVSPALTPKPALPPARPALPPLPRSVPPPLPAGVNSYSSASASNARTTAPLAPATSAAAASKANAVSAAAATCSFAPSTAALTLSGTLTTSSSSEEVVPSAPPMPDYLLSSECMGMAAQSASPAPFYPPMPGYYPPPPPNAAAAQQPVSQLPYPAAFAQAPQTAQSAPPAYAFGAGAQTAASAWALPQPQSRSLSTATSAALPPPPPYSPERPAAAASLYPSFDSAAASSPAVTPVPPARAAPAPAVLLVHEHPGAQGAGPSMAATLDPSAAGASIPSRIDTPEGITVLLVDGSILDEPTDLMVFATTDRPTLSSRVREHVGPRRASKMDEALLKAVREVRAATQTVPQQHRPGLPGEQSTLDLGSTVVFEADTKKLRVKYIMHVVLPSFDEGSPDVLQEIYRKAVLHALADAFVSRRLRSISFTALGIGQRLCYPAPLLASWLLDGVLEFARVSAHVRTAINPKLPHLVRIVLPSRLILDTGVEQQSQHRSKKSGSAASAAFEVNPVWDVFRDTFLEKFALHYSSPRRMFVDGVRFPKAPQVEVVRGDVLLSRYSGLDSPAIVRLTGESLEHTPLDGVMLAAGEKVFEECHKIGQLHENVAITSSGRLSPNGLKHIVHILRHDGSPASITDCVLRALAAAERAKCGALVIPPMAVASTNFQQEAVAAAMMQGVETWLKGGGPNALPGQLAPPPPKSKKGKTPAALVTVRGPGKHLRLVRIAVNHADWAAYSALIDALNARFNSAPQSAAGSGVFAAIASKP